MAHDPGRPDFRMISSIRMLPESVRELGDFYRVSLECERCERTHPIYPGPARYAPALRIPAMLYGHSCGECGAPYSHLVLALAGRGIPAHAHNKTGQWLLDRAGHWTERRGGFWEDFDYDEATRRNVEAQEKDRQLSELRVRDLVGATVVVFTCGAFTRGQSRGRRCRHSKTLRLDQLAYVTKPDDRILDLPRRAKCEKCGQRSPHTTVEILAARR